jgi:hypothetical protein
MHRLSGRVVLVAVSVALVLATVAATAGAHKGKGQGKKAMGTVESFDGTTISVDVGEDEAVTATVDDDTKIKVEHRGHHARGKGHGNPSRGTTDDLAEGAFVLDMKIDDGHLDRIRVRPVTHGEPTETPTETPTEAPTETPTPTETASPAPSETPTV